MDQSNISEELNKQSNINEQQLQESEAIITTEQADLLQEETQEEIEKEKNRQRIASIAQSVRKIKLTKTEDQKKRIDNSSQVVNMGAKKRNFKAKHGFNELKEKTQNAFNLTKAIDGIKQHQNVDDYDIEMGEAKVLYQEFMEISFDEVDLTSDKAIVAKAVWFENLASKTHQIRNIMLIYPKLIDIKEQSVYKKQLETAEKITAYYEIKKSLILDPAYAKKYSKELPYKSRKGMSAKDIEIQRKLWMAEACLERLNEDVHNIYNLKFQDKDKTEDELSSEMSAYKTKAQEMEANGATMEIGKEIREISDSPNASYFRNIMKSVDKADDIEETKRTIEEAKDISEEDVKNAEREYQEAKDELDSAEKEKNKEAKKAAKAKGKKALAILGRVEEKEKAENKLKELGPITDEEREAIRKYKVVTTVPYTIPGTDFVMTEAFTRNFANLPNVKFIKEADPSVVATMMENVTARPKNLEDKASVEESARKNLEGIRMMKDLIIQHTRYLNEKYGSGLADLSSEDYIAHVKELTEDFVNAQGLEAVLELCKSIPGMMSKSDYMLADDFAFHRHMMQVKGGMPRSTKDKESMTEVMRVEAREISEYPGGAVRYFEKTSKGRKTINWDTKPKLKSNANFSKEILDQQQIDYTQAEKMYSAFEADLEGSIKESEESLQAETKRFEYFKNKNDKGGVADAQKGIETVKRNIKRIEDQKTRLFLEKISLKETIISQLETTNTANNLIKTLDNTSPIYEAMESFNQYQKGCINSDEDFITALKGYIDLKVALDNSSSELSEEVLGQAKQLLKERGAHILSEKNRYYKKLKLDYMNDDEVNSFKLPTSIEEYNNTPIVHRYQTTSRGRNILLGNINGRAIMNKDGAVFEKTGHKDFKVPDSDNRMIISFNIRLIKEDGTAETDVEKLGKITQSYIDCVTGPEQQRFEAIKEHIIDIDTKLNAFTENIMNKFNMSVENGELMNAPEMNLDFIEQNKDICVGISSIDAVISSLKMFYDGTEIIGNGDYDRQKLYEELHKPEISKTFDRIVYNYDILYNFYKVGYTTTLLENGIKPTDLTIENTSLYKNSEQISIMMESEKEVAKVLLKESYQKIQSYNS